MTLKQTRAVLKIIDRERRKDLKDQLAIQALAARADPKELAKMLKD